MALNNRSSTLAFKRDQLIGRTNFIEQKKEAILFLEIGGYMPYINSSKTSLIKTYYYNSNSEFSLNKLAIKYIDKKVEFDYNKKKALGALKLIISLENIN